MIGAPLSEQSSMSPPNTHRNEGAEDTPEESSSVFNSINKASYDIPDPNLSRYMLGTLYDSILWGEYETE